MCGCMTTVQQQIQGSLNTSVMQAAGTWQPDPVDSTGYTYDKFLTYGPQMHICTHRTSCTTHPGQTDLTCGAVLTGPHHLKCQVTKQQGSSLQHYANTQKY